MKHVCNSFGWTQASWPVDWLGRKPIFIPAFALMTAGWSILRCERARIQGAHG